jgi:hypothetical protein
MMLTPYFTSPPRRTIYLLANGGIVALASHLSL